MFSISLASRPDASCATGSDESINVAVEHRAIRVKTSVR
jgi:hypothetical protein